MPTKQAIRSASVLVTSADSKLRMHHIGVFGHYYYHIRRRFQKSSTPSKSFNEYSSTQDDTTHQWSADDAFAIPHRFNGRLPTELLILIGTYVERKRDFARLCMASKEFRLVYAPFLFRVIEIKGPSGPNSTVMQLAAVLPTSNLSQLVTELYVHLQRDRACAKRVESRVQPELLHPEQRVCECGKYDEALGQLLASVQNLKILEIRCNLCDESHNHDHIHHSEMPRLTSFTFRCLCLEARSQPLRSILLAPCMNHVKVLNVACSYNRWYGFPPADATRLRGAVPNLHTLFHCGGKAYSKLLAAQRVERLHLDEYQGCNTLRGQAIQSLHEDICLSPGVLSHLSMVDILAWLPPAMKERIEPYQHLRFIGTMFLDSEETIALAALQVLAPLKALESIAMHQTHTTNLGCIISVFKPSLEFFVLLGQDLPSLRRVFLLLHLTPVPRHLESTLWEKLGTWERRSIPQLEPWDLVCGKVDTV